MACPTTKEVIVSTNVKHPFARQIMQELDGKRVPKTADMVYKVIFEE